MPRNAKTSVYKEKEFETYVLWKSVPAYFRGMKKQQLLSHGFTDPLIIKTVMIKNQTQFAKIFHIKDLGTLTDWNIKMKNENLLSNKFEKMFEEQISNAHHKISFQPKLILENKMREQRSLISSLKKQNLNYKKQLRVLSKKKSIVERETVFPTKVEVVVEEKNLLKENIPTPPPTPMIINSTETILATEILREKMHLSEPKPSTSFFQKIKNLFS